MSEKGAATREAIISRAVDLVSALGFEGVTIGSLAVDLGMSKSGLFGHFRSKENLQLEVLEAAVVRYTDQVLAVALKVPRGEPRVRAFFDNWLDWAGGTYGAGGCIFIAAANELDDREGPLRDRLVAYQQTWLDGLARAASIAVEERHFRSDLDPEQFAYEFYSIILAYHHAWRLMRDPRSGDRAQAAFERLLRDARPVAST